MHLRALQMPAAAWMLLAAVLMAGTLGRSIPRLRPANDVTWHVTSTDVVQPAARAPRRAAVAPTGRPRANAGDRVEKRKAAAVLLFMVLGGRNGFGAGSR